MIDEDLKFQLELKEALRKDNWRMDELEIQEQRAQLHIKTQKEMLATYQSERQFVTECLINTTAILSQASKRVETLLEHLRRLDDRINHSLNREQLLAMCELPDNSAKLQLFDEFALNAYDLISEEKQEQLDRWFAEYTEREYYKGIARDGILD